MRPVIEIRGLTFRHPHGKTLFEGLDFTLYEGQRVGLVGPNGSGKTTLFHLIMGLLRPAQGEIRIFGKPCRDEEDFREARRKVGFLFQDSDDQLFYPTVREDIAFGPLNLGRSHAEAREIVKHYCARLGLAGLEDAVTHRLSGGEKRLVALTAVAAMEPRCLLLDEPTSGLDEEKTGLLLAYLRDSAKTCIVATHDRQFLRHAADRVFALRPGEGIAELSA